MVLVFSSRGLELSLGRDALDEMETMYDIVFETADDRTAFVEEVSVSSSVDRWCAGVRPCRAVRASTPRRCD
jgi:hypothetical protein